MNNAGTRITLTLGLLALVMGASLARAETYIVEPITDAADGAATQGFSQAELDQMLAPIALYPDALLSQVLIAATYPLEIVEAARWSRQNAGLSGEAAVAAAADQEWDPSVKSLVAFPDLLARMDEDLDWTRRLGDAMLFQESQVMDSIQLLRARADATGTLETTEYVKVIRDEKTIVIEPRRTRIVHVPYYDPYVVYGDWWWPAYRPIVWAPPAYYYGYGGYPGFYWGSGIHISAGFFYSSFYWPHRSVVIVHAPRYYTPPRHWHGRPYYRHYTYTPGQRWHHNPVHRRGVAYRQPEVRDRYVRYSPGTRSVTTGTFSGAQRPPRDGAAGGRGGNGRNDAQVTTRDGQRSTQVHGGRVAQPEDRTRSERTEQRFTSRDTARGPSTPGPEVRSRQEARSDAQRVERRLATSGSAEVRGGSIRSSNQPMPPQVQGSRLQAGERSAPTVRSTRVVPEATERATAPSRGTLATRPGVAEPSRQPLATRPAAPQRSSAPSRIPQASRPSAAPRAAAPPPAREASPPTTAQRSAPAPSPRATVRSTRPDSGSRSRSSGGDRESRSRR